MNTIPIEYAKEARESIGATHLVIFAVTEDGQQHVATHGETRVNAQEAAKAGNKLKSALGWPDELCKSKPLPRLCENCAYWKADWGMHCMNGWTGDGTKGHCHLEPKRVAVVHDNTCRHFEPSS
jgi:hypothetical protein